MKFYTIRQALNHAFRELTFVQRYIDTLHQDIVSLSMGDDAVITHSRAAEITGLPLREVRRIAVDLRNEAEDHGEGT